MGTSDYTSKERQRRWYNSHREFKNNLNKEKYWGFRILGLCPTCSGKNEAVKGKALCSMCQEKRNEKTNNKTPKT